MSKGALVIGAGISGLAAARAVHDAGIAVTVLEARDRIGGRALSIDLEHDAALDLGPAWLWPGYQPRVAALLEELGLETIPQFEDGKFLFEDEQGVREFEYPKRYSDAVRVRGGLASIAHGLQGSMPGLDLRLESPVSGVEFTPNDVVATTNDGRLFAADRLVFAVPPPLVAPMLAGSYPERELQNALVRWPTWMAAHAKFIAVYPDAFWREQGYSGSAVSHRGPLMEVVDHSDTERGLAALFGFVGLPASERASLGVDQLNHRCTEQLARLFGPQARNARDTYFMDWATESFTATDADLAAPQTHPPYGERALRQLWFDRRVAFASAESAASHGGLVEGALLAGEAAAASLMAS